MSDDKNRKGPEDQDRINLNQPYEVRYWTKELSINEATLRIAVKEVGDMVVSVRAWLNQTENKWRRVN